jgi:DNA-binding XRE family transcriptional regulator
VRTSRGGERGGDEISKKCGSAAPTDTVSAGVREARVRRGNVGQAQTVAPGSNLHRSRKTKPAPADDDGKVTPVDAVGDLIERTEKVRAAIDAAMATMPKRVAGKVKNRVEHFRKKADLTQTGLALKVNTSQQQISRIEKGQDTSPHLAVEIAQALGQSLDAVFPDLKALKSIIDAGGDTRKLHEVFDRAGFVPPSGWRTTFVRFDMYMGDRKDTVERFIYPIDDEEVQRIARNLINVNEPDERDAFLAFSSVGRHIYVNIRYIQKMHHLVEPFAMNVSELKPDFRRVNIYFRGSRKPFSTPTEELEMEEFEAFMFLEDKNARSLSRFMDFFDEDGERVIVNTDDIVITEIPSEELLHEFDKMFENMDEAEIENFYQEEFHGDTYKGKKLTKTRRDEIHGAMLERLAIRVDEYVKYLATERNLGSFYDISRVIKSAEFGLRGLFKPLRKYGFSIVPGEPTEELDMTDRYYSRLRRDLTEAFADAVKRASQRGHDTGEYGDGGMIDFLVIEGLASLRDAGYALMPHNQFIAGFKRMNANETAPEEKP